MEVRLDELRRFLQADWASSPDPARVLKDLAMLDAEPIPVQAVRQQQEQATRQAPDDARVWLALRQPRDPFQPARRGRVLGPPLPPAAASDPAVVRSWLDWAVAAGRSDEAARALEALPDDALDPAKVLQLEAWFAARTGDHDRERQALKALTDLVPGQIEALDRLALLALRQGHREEAQEYRRLKEQANQAREHYLELLSRSDFAEQAAELSRLAGQLGRSFESEGWLQLSRRGSDPTPLRRPESTSSLSRVELRRLGPGARPGRPLDVDGPA